VSTILEQRIEANRGRPNKDKDACPKGHSYLRPENVYIDKQGKRHCRRCDRMRHTLHRRDRETRPAGYKSWRRKKVSW